jgi:hypothetical protein
MARTARWSAVLTDLIGRLQTSASDGGQTNPTPGQRVEQAGIDFVL